MVTGNSSSGRPWPRHALSPVLNVDLINSAAWEECQQALGNAEPYGLLGQELIIFLRVHR